MMTPRLEQLINDLEKTSERSWIQEVLLACLQRLGSGGPTEWQIVEVFDAWIDGDALYIVYTSPWGPVAGLIRGSENPADDDAAQCGEMIADFDVAEPLGTYAEDLTYDNDDVGWWGDPIPGSILEGRGQGHP